LNHNYYFHRKREKMNFSNSRNFFNSFYKNAANNKNSMKYFNCKINSMKSLNFFSNKLNFSRMIILSNILFGTRLTSILNADCLATETNSTEPNTSKKTMNELINELNSKFLNEIVFINKSNI